MLDRISLDLKFRHIFGHNLVAYYIYIYIYIYYMPQNYYQNVLLVSTSVMILCPRGVQETYNA